MFEYGVSKGIDKDKLISVHNKAGVRITSLGETDQTTPITYGQVYEAFPFDNDVRLVKVKGSYLTRDIVKDYIKVQGTITKDSLQLNYPQSLSLHIEKQTIQQLLF